MTKLIAKLLLLVIILSACFTLSGCSIKIEPTWRSLNTSFMVTIDGVKQQKVIDFEISKYYYLDIKFFGNVDIDDDTHKDIKIEYNEKNASVTYAYDSPKSKTLTFNIYLYELGNNDTLKITYNGKTVEVVYNVIDYDFEGYGYILPDSLNYLDKYPEFKEMLLSIKYYEFQEPYIGVPKYDFHIINGEKYIEIDLERDENDPNYASTDYLKYFLDSVYYPAKYDLVLKNPVAHRYMYYRVPKETNTDAGSERSVMDSFGLGFSLIDPCCTDPQYPLQNISFGARNKEFAKNNPSKILLEKYPEKYFKYKMGDITIYILIHKENGASAYFEDDTYFYQMSTYYETK